MERRLSVLAVDDEEKNLELMEAMLIPLGYEVITARGGKEAMEKISKNMPDVILLDIMMPEMDGGKVRQRLKENPKTSKIPVIYITSLLSKKEEAEYGGRLPSGEYLVAKPCTADEISKAINLALA